MDEISLLLKKLEREKLARKQAESILESKALELFKANESLRNLNQNLERTIEARTKTLAATEERYRNLVEQARDLIYNIDVNGNFLYVNAIGFQQFGYSDEIILGKNFLEFIPVEDRKIELEYYEAFLKSEKSTDYHEFRVISSKGEIHWLGQNVSKVLNDGKELYITGVARDITQRKATEYALQQAQVSLQKSEIKYRSIIENMQLGLMEVDTSGKILRVYERFNQMLGYQGEELVGKNANETLLVSDFEKVLEEEDSKRLEGQTGVYEVKLRKKDQSEIWVLISGAPFYDVTGKVIGSIGVHYDITDRKELQRQLEITRLQAVRAQKAEKAFLANMSHEIRTPLNAIIGMSHLLLDTRLDEEQKDYLEVLSSSTHILKSLISDILDISKIDAGSLDVQIKAFNLRELVENLISIFEIQNDLTTVSYHLHFDNRIPTNILGDPQLLNQILLNLLSNATKFTNSGSITLQVGTIENLGNRTTRIQFEIIDTGIGISEEDCRLIFEEFKQANSQIREKYGGTGLGLTISNQLVKLLGGKLKVESSQQKGSTFSFNLIFEVAEEVKNVNATSNQIQPKRKNGYKILVVEDNAMNQKYISSLLKKWNLPFDICENGKVAYEMSSKHTYDIIFMDLQMPVMDGFEATQLIRSESELNRNTPIVALTASTFLSKKRLALKAGMSDFLSKPFTPDQLSSIIDQFLKRNSDKHYSSDGFLFTADLDHEYLNTAYGADLEYGLDMFQTFVEIIADEMILIRDTIHSGKIAEVKKSLHRIKPTFKMVGLSPLFADIEKIEEKIGGTDLLDLTEWIDEFTLNLNKRLPLIELEIKRMLTWLNN